MNPNYSMAERGGEKKFWWSVLLIAILGAFLRLYQLDRQVVLDDEWHAIYWAAKSSLVDILTHFHEADNCIPLTAYYKLVLDTIGLNELWLRFPQILSGLLCLIVFPPLVSSAVGRRTAVIFSFLLSISPFLVYYSRFARPYIIIVFLSFVALFSFYLWIVKRKKRYLGLYLVAAVLAPYFHLPSFVAVTTPLIYFVACITFEKASSWQHAKGVYSGIKHMVCASSVLFVGWIILFYPTIHSLGAITQKINGGLSDVRFTTLIGAANLFNGSTVCLVSFFLTAMFFHGAYLLFKKNFFLFGYMFAIMLLTVVSLAILRPLAVQEAEVFARYSICVLPLWILFIAISLEDFSFRLGGLIPVRVWLGNIFVAGLLLIIFISSPLFIIYRYPNNFTNHIDFQDDYLSNWTRINLNTLKNPIPQFYFYLRNRPEETTIIETPFLVTALGDQFHIYQRVHHKNVIIGHSGFSYLAQSDHVMNSNMHFRNFVATDDYNQIVKSNSAYVVVHKDMVKEFLFIRKNFPDFKFWVDVVKKNRSQYDSYATSAKKEAIRTISFLEQFCGKPFYEDALIVVFKVKS